MLLQPYPLRTWRPRQWPWPPFRTYATAAKVILDADTATEWNKATIEAAEVAAKITLTTRWLLQ